eukprot:Gb_11707 [translate_table: standard]
MADLSFEDFREEYRLESGLSREEIERLTVDENLSEIERTILFLSPTAHVLQQSCALERLPSIFHDHGLAAYNALFPALSVSIDQFTPAVQAAAGKAFHMIMEDESLPADLASFLLPMAVRMLNSTQSNVLYAWLQTICAMAPKLPMKVGFRMTLSQYGHHEHIKFKSEYMVNFTSNQLQCSIGYALTPPLDRPITHGSRILP